MSEITAVNESDLTVAAPFAMLAPEVLDRLGVTDQGLSSAQAQRRAEVVGPNELPKPPRKPAILRFLAHFDDVLIYILIAAAVLKAIMGEWVDSATVFLVAVINAVIGYVQEGRAESALDSIRGMLSSDAEVLRDGAWGSVPAAALVPGDIIRVRAGDKVPADARVLTAANLLVEESALTGEAVSSRKDDDPVVSDAGVGDRSSMLFSGTIVSTGQAEAVVTATGGATELGRIQAMVTEAAAEDTDTPLTRQLAGFGKYLSLGILAMAAVMLLIGRLIHDFPAAELISAAIGFAVAAIPEGLPALVTITLALGVQQMARHNAITRRLPSVETLGAVTTICSDKTGTLTQNEMTVRHVVTAAHRYDVTGTGYAPNGFIAAPGAGAGEPGPCDLDADAALGQLVATAALCNDATLVPAEPGAQGPAAGWQLVGEPTEGALAALALKTDFAADAYQRAAVLPFDSEYKYMAVRVTTPAGGSEILLKGAPDRVLQRCEFQAGPDGGRVPIDVAFWEQQIGDLGRSGLRVLAFAVRDTSSPGTTVTHDDVAGGLTFLGITGIVDPPRPEAIDAIRLCHDAGIRVKMITGDHADTALAIAREMGIVTDAQANVLTGAELESMPQSRLERLAPKVDVYARTSPEHKIRIVRALQARGEVVSMTGDGVNDAPALTRADVGVAMGIKGTEATKDAADIVLADDNFATIERAVEQGRRIYDNIKKSVVFLLPTNGAQALVVLVAVLAGWAMPLEPVQILWVNMVTAVTLSLALAYEPAEPDIMSRPPRSPKAPLVGSRSLLQITFVSVLIGAATIAMYFWTMNQGIAEERVQTVAIMMLTFGQLAYLFNCRFLESSSIRRSALGSNRVLWLSVGSLIALQVLFTYVPVMNFLFHSAPISWQGWVLPAVCAVGIFFVVELWKWAARVIYAGRESRSAALVEE